MSQERTRIAELVSNALDNFDDPTQSTTSLVRQAARIAALRRDYPAQLRLQAELVDVTSGALKTDPIVARIRADMVTLLGADEAERQYVRTFEAYINDRTVPDKDDSVHGLSIAQIENNLATVRRAYDEFSVEDKGSTIYAHEAAIAADRGQAKILPTIVLHSTFVERVRQHVHNYLILAETELAAGQPTGDVFQRGLDYVREQLAARVPAALEKFTAAEERLSAGTPEDLSQALTSTRRMIKDLADYLYPATGVSIVGEDKVEREMSEDAYRNRLIQYAKEQLGSQLQGKVLSDTLRSYGVRLTNLDSMASKGVHGAVSAAEAEQCIVWTFFLTADLLRIEDGSATEMRTGSQS